MKPRICANCKHFEIHPAGDGVCRCKDCERVAHYVEWCEMGCKHYEEKHPGLEVKPVLRSMNGQEWQIKEKKP